MSVATATPDISEVQVSIPVEGTDETVSANITGTGDIAVIIAYSGIEDPSTWLPLINPLSLNSKLRIVTFTYRSVEATTGYDTRAVYDFLSTQNHINKIICVGAGLGANGCVNLQKKPGIIGMVLMAGNIFPVQAEFPKLFLTADADPIGLAGATEVAYEYSSDPKVFKSYPAGVHGSALFSKPDVGPQILADITDFINGIVNGP